MLSSHSNEFCFLVFFFFSQLMDSGHTRSLDPTMPVEKMVHPGLAAVNDIETGTTFGADEVSNLDPVPRPYEEEPKPLERVPFRDGMEELSAK
jgi:hypothetical protein